MKTKPTLKPILSYASGSGWQTLGHALTSDSAARFIKSHVLSSESISLIENHGFKLTVAERSDLAIELNGGPSGFIYSIGKVVHH